MYLRDCARPMSRRARALPLCISPKNHDLANPLRLLLHSNRPRLINKLNSIFCALPTRAFRDTLLYIPRRVHFAMAVHPLFALAKPATDKFGPRTGILTIERDGSGVHHQTETPALLTATSRGIVPHLSRDHLHISPAIQHVQLPFESL